MIEEDAPPENQNSTENMLYDWFKHLTSLSLLTLGGVLSLSQLPSAADIERPVLVAILIAVGIAGICAFSGAEQIVRARAGGKPLPASVFHLQRAAPLILSGGVGAFLYIFQKAVS